MTGVNFMIEKNDQPRMTIKIGELSLLVICPEESLYEQLHDRYADFLDLNRAKDSVKIVHGGKVCRSESVIPDSKFEGDQLLLCGRFMQGFFDPLSRYGELILSDINPVKSVEYYLRSIFAMLAFNRGGVLFHSAGVVRDEVCYLFFGHSGSGKTTVVGLSPDNTILNDDLIVLLPGEECWFAHGTPFSNLDQVIGVNSNAPVAGLFNLIQDESTYLEKMHSSIAVAECLANIPIVSGIPSLSDSLMQRCQRLVTDIPTYRLYFQKEPAFWDLVESAGK